MSLLHNDNKTETILENVCKAFFGKLFHDGFS